MDTPVRRNCLQAASELGPEAQRMRNTFRWAVALGLVVAILPLGSPAHAASYTCSNRVEGHDGFYTNNDLSSERLAATVIASNDQVCDSNTNPGTNRNFVQEKI